MFEDDIRDLLVVRFHTDRGAYFMQLHYLHLRELAAIPFSLKSSNIYSSILFLYFLGKLPQLVHFQLDLTTQRGKGLPRHP